MIEAARRGRYEACHVFESDDFGSEGFHLAGFVDEVFVGEDFFGLSGLFTEEAGEESFGGFSGLGFGVDGVAHGSVGDAAEGVDHLYGVAHVVDVVEGIEDAHHVESVGDCFFIESFEDAVGVWHVAEEVAAAGKGGEERLAFHHFRHRAEAVPGGFIEVAHHGVGHCAAPHFHDVEAGILVVREKFVDFGLAQTCCEERLLAVAECEVADFKFSISHIYIKYKV